jgi:hypothetical protein
MAAERLYTVVQLGKLDLFRHLTKCINESMTLVNRPITYKLHPTATQERTLRQYHKLR